MGKMLWTGLFSVAFVVWLGTGNEHARDAVFYILAVMGVSELARIANALQSKKGDL